MRPFPNPRTSWTLELATLLAILLPLVPLPGAAEGGHGAAGAGSAVQLAQGPAARDSTVPQKAYVPEELDPNAQKQAPVPLALDPAERAALREGMVLVPAGEFTMGSSEKDSWSETDEMPQHIVKLPAFLIDQLEVSNMDYKRFVDATGWPPPPSWKDGTYREGTEFIPVTEVTWWDAMGYARWAGKRLPTEAEWEKAARGADGRRFPWGEKFSADLANNGPNPLPVGSKPQGASPYEAVDMAGNVAEWTATVYEPYPQLKPVLPSEFGGAQAGSAVASPSQRPSAAKTARTIEADDPRLAFFTRDELSDVRPRVYRGGSFNSYARFLRCANREKEDPGARWPNLGFRCAADPDSTGSTKP